MPRKTAASAPSPIDDLPPRRRAILSAAYSVLMERGYAHASTIEIATRAKVSKRELYAEFGSKSGILKALIAASADRMLVPLAPTHLADRKALAATLTSYGRQALTELTHPEVLAVNRLAIAEADRSVDLGRILDDAGREPNRRTLAALIARAQQAGLLGAGDPDQIGGQYFSLLFGDLQLRLLMGVAAPPNSREALQRAEAATRAVLALHPAG